MAVSSCTTSKAAVDALFTKIPPEGPWRELQSPSYINLLYCRFKPYLRWGRIGHLFWNHVLRMASNNSSNASYVETLHIRSRRNSYTIHCSWWTFSQNKNIFKTTFNFSTSSTIPPTCCKIRCVLFIFSFFHSFKAFINSVVYEWAGDPLSITRNCFNNLSISPWCVTQLYICHIKISFNLLLLFLLYCYFSLLFGSNLD